MIDGETSHARATLSDATRVERQTRTASRWFPRYMLLIGVLAFAVIVAIEAFFPSGTARILALVAWALAVGLLGWWAESHDVHPEGAGRRLWLAFAVWFGSYLVVIGPLIRWQFGDSLAWWSVAAAVMASPFVIVAWWERRRS